MQNSSILVRVDARFIMIRRIQFYNFCSFLEEAVVDFTTTFKTSTNDSFVRSDFDDQVALLTGVFGPNDECVSEAFRLDELKGVRREENFFANYNSGRYGAIPEPEIVAF